MKGIKLLLLAMLISVSAFSQITPWTGTPAVTWQTRNYSGEKQIRALFGTSLISFMDSLHKFATKTQLQLAKDSLVNLYTTQTIMGDKTYTGITTYQNAIKIDGNGTDGSQGFRFKYTGGYDDLYYNPAYRNLTWNRDFNFNGTIFGLQSAIFNRASVDTPPVGATDVVRLVDLTSRPDSTTISNKYLLKTDTAVLARKIGSADMVQKSYNVNNQFAIYNFSSYASPPPNLQYLAMRSIVPNSPTRIGVFVNGIPPTATVHTFLSGFKIFRTDFQADTLNNSDFGVYATNADNRFNSKFNGTGLQYAPFKWSFQDTQIKMTLNQFGLGLGGDVTANYPLDINYSTALNDQGFNVLATETASNRTLYGGRISASNPSGTGSNIIGLQVTADKGATTGVMGSTGLDVINNIGARAAGGTATTYKGAQITLNGSTATSSTSTSVTNNALQVIMANTTAVGETGTDRGGIITVTSMTGKTAKGLEVNVSGGTTNIALDVLAGTMRYAPATASSLAGFDAGKNLATITALPSGTTATTQAAGTNNTTVATSAALITERTAAGTLNNKILAPANTYQASTGTTNDSLRFASSQRMVEKALVAGSGVTITQTATSVTIGNTNSRSSVNVVANQTMVLNTDYQNISTTQYVLTLPPCTSFATQGSLLITVLSTGTGGAKISVPSGYALQTPAGATLTDGTGYVTIAQNQKIQLIPSTTTANTYYCQPLNGTITVH